MSKGFGGLPGNMQALMKQAQKMQEDMQRAQEEAAQFQAEGSAGGGMVRVVVNGKHEAVSVSIDRQVVNPDDVEMLQDLIVAAFNESVRKVEDNLKTKLSSITGGLSIPGLF